MDTGPLVVVTGGSGLLGSKLIRRLISDYRVIGLDLAGDPRSPAEVEFICTDLTSDRSVSRAFDRIRAVAGNHIASVVLWSPPRRSGPGFSRRPSG